MAALPEDSETLAAWLLPSVTTCVEDERGGAWPLPALVETEGPAAAPYISRWGTGSAPAIRRTGCRRWTPC